MALAMFCPLLKCSGSRSIMYCIYVCKVGTKIKCNEYTRKFELLKAAVVEVKYITKYGIPEYPLPISMRKRRSKQPKGVQADGD